MLSPIGAVEEEHGNVSIYFNTVVFKIRLHLCLCTEPLVIQASRPVYVVQFGLSFDYDGHDGGAFETSVQSLTHFSSEYVFPAPLENFANTLIITIKKRHRQALLLDGSSLQVWKNIHLWFIKKAKNGEKKQHNFHKVFVKILALAISIRYLSIKILKKNFRYLSKS